MVKDDVIKKIVFRLGNEIDTSVLQSVLYFELNNYDIVEQTKNEIVEYNQTRDQKAIHMFFVSKKVEGCSDKTIKHYQNTIKSFLSVIHKPFEEITTNDIRYYIAKRGTVDKVSKVTQNNERLVISSLFAWLTAEEYILRNPMLSFKKIKQDKQVKKPFSEEEMELLRRACKNKRELAVLEFLFSTGCRCGELEEIRIENIDFDAGKLFVIGKGNKERCVFLNPKAKVAIREYIAERGSPTRGALFESQTYKGRGLKVSGIEIIVRNIGKRAGIEKCHPHRMRRTTATTALNRGMPIDQVKEMLGHESIATTTIYALTDKENLQASHKKYVV